ncbi:hypothetical protein [Bradyrhizobium sp. CCBAU 21360]|uniref:hypothetical protein n=1 Tax=Bradyrhizobium sp. CCBAU 21360 TaxID=1325081 RepID=UPI002305269F|nr:hypothetical protein [Bradyrhizobium sp. CCBAU 21360]
MLRVIRRRNRFEASSIGAVSVYPCIGGRDDEAGKHLHAVLEGLPPGKVPIRALHIGDPKPDDAERGWFQGPGFWLERDPVEEGASLRNERFLPMNSV